MNAYDVDSPKFDLLLTVTWFQISIIEVIICVDFISG